MLFPSQIFLFYFLPLFMATYFCFRGQLRLFVLGLASTIFYGWWDWRFIGLIFLSVIVDYLAGQNIFKSKVDKVKKKWLIASIVSNLSVLGFFKYFIFFNQSLAGLSSFFGFSYPDNLLTMKIVLPVGISFYTFQSMSYTIDIYRGKIKPAKNLNSFYAYVSMFPQLVAGPIVRYSHLEKQMLFPSFSADRLYLGVQFFILGMAKKVIIADSVAPLADSIFDATSFASLGAVHATIAVIAYAIQIYFDFSGYSDMAVGLGYFCGYKFPQNFDSPYKSKSITEFWRRWHMTLSSWLRDYLYIPLGGNRKGKLRTYINLMLTMFLGGLWHGASWNFAIWGMLHGSYLAIERSLGSRNPLLQLPGIFQKAVIFSLVCFAWIFFRAKDLPTAFNVISLFRVWDKGFTETIGGFDTHQFATLMFGLGLVFLSKNTWEITPRVQWSKTLATATLFVLSIAFLFGNTSHPFLYFQF